MPLPEATLHGAAEIAVPTLVSTLAISCVFTSVVFLDGPAKYLFTPLGLAVVFAMLASYGLSRTLTPITIGLLLKSERRHGEGGAERLVRAVLRCIRARLRAPARWLFEAPDDAASPTGHRARRRRADARPRRDDVHVCRARLLPADRRRTDPAACSRARGNAHREHGGDLPGGRGQDPRSHSRKRALADRRQYRTAGAVLQSGIRRWLDDRGQ